MSSLFKALPSSLLCLVLEAWGCFDGYGVVGHQHWVAVKIASAPPLESSVALLMKESQLLPQS